MDDPALERHEHEKALRGLQRINAWTGNAALVWKHVAPVAGDHRDRPLRILDIATGAADIPIALAKAGAAAGHRLEIDACDCSATAIDFAAANCAAARVPVRLFRLDVLGEQIPARYDVVTCSQFLHHLSNAEVEIVLRKMSAAATRRVLVVDLERGLANWLQVWFGTRALSRSKVVHFDGPQSIRAAFTVEEFRHLADKAGFARFTIRRKWPCRFVLIGDHDGGA
jgi:2-polyprenyl-3-methyl-5-hydroxy-6-metoxy-1,4-benzoquinol methylase